MSTEATLDSDEETIGWLSGYETKTWIGNELSFRTETDTIIRLKYDDANIKFFGFGPFDQMQMKKEQIMNVLLSSQKQKIYIEWNQKTGKFLYFNLLKVVKDSNGDSLSIAALRKDENACFDESTSPSKTGLTANDIVILSPIRSFELCYSSMGGHCHLNKLFLGGLPSTHFIKEYKIRHLVNCCQVTNDEKIKAMKECKELHFDVCGWSVGDIESGNEDEEEAKECNVKVLQLRYLDERIDEIEEMVKGGNVLIHCLAGAHRSPFITACYLYKYGNTLNKMDSAKQIYKWMMEKREVVEPMGYDQWLDDYIKYLKK